MKRWYLVNGKWFKKRFAFLPTFHVFLALECRSRVNVEYGSWRFGYLIVCYAFEIADIDARTRLSVWFVSIPQRENLLAK